MAREIVLDTETTGLDPRSGHRLIELACLELEDFIPTGKSFHRYIHPQRDIEAEAQAVHGISIEFLKDKPRFEEVCDEFLEFVGDSPLIAHNAGFDRNFVNHELTTASRRTLPDGQWIDTLKMAQQRFPGMYNSLDALCKRYKISLAEREKHGALIDCRLLAAVYLELSGGRERGLDLSATVVAAAALQVAERSAYGPRPRPLAPRSTEAERATHLEFINVALKGGGLWAELGLDEA